MDCEVPTGKLNDFRKVAAQVARGSRLKEPADPLWGGLRVEAWFVLYHACHAFDGMGGVRRIEWPEAGGYAEQPAIVVRAFDLVQDAVIKQMIREADRERGRSK